MRDRIWRRGLQAAGAALLLLLVTGLAVAQDEQPIRISRKGEIGGMTDAEIVAAMPEYFHRDNRGRVVPADIPDIYGPGAVLNVGNVAMKITNFGLNGNGFPYYSTDPSGQWPGVSGVEYMGYFSLAVGAVNPTATDPIAMRRVSHLLEWRPATLDPVDKIYKTYDGVVGGIAFYDDDKDMDKYTMPWDKRDHLDEDFLDGHDNDLDGKVDEDYAAFGQQEFTLVMRDDTPQAINASATEKHVPLGLECQQEAWAYSIEPNTNFDIIRWTIYNRSGHTLDSLTVGGIVDMDCGPIDKSNYWTDDKDLGSYPSGTFPFQVDTSSDERAQTASHRDPKASGSQYISKVPVDSSLCSHFSITTHGFSVADDDGDLGRTSGIPSFLLIDHTVDPTGENGPSRVGFKSFRSYTGGTPYTQGGYPRVDQDKFESMVGAAQPTGVDEDGNINTEPGEEKGDYAAWWSCGVWRNVPDGGSIQVTVAFTVGQGLWKDVQRWRLDYQAFKDMPDGVGKEGAMAALFNKYKNLSYAYAAQVAAEGIYEDRPEWAAILTRGHGRETVLHPKPGEPPIYAADCRDGDAGARTINSSQDDWFDFDCDYCTGAYDSKQGRGMFHHTWVASAPPPSPNMNVASSYNYSDNPNRVVPAGDNQVMLAWDNSSETTKDPKTGQFDARGYRVWKAANWQRPVGAAGPSDDDWSLLGEFRLFYFFIPGQYTLMPTNAKGTTAEGDTIWPRVFVPSYHYAKGSVNCDDPAALPASDGGCIAPTARHVPAGSIECARADARPAADGGCFVPDSVEIRLYAGDIWNHSTGEILHPQPVECERTQTGECSVFTGCELGTATCVPEQRTRYQVGRFRYVDHEVKNGFVYFYSVTAFDSTVDKGVIHEQHSRRSAAEADMVVPQSGASAGKNVWVVPNPYRGFHTINDRPSSWDMIPNGSDPTGTHVDFMGMPRGKWTLKIFTVSGDLVQTLHSEDPVNESVRPQLSGPNGTSVPGYNRQQDNANDGEARWNLISRNGQDVVSGIYLFTVESDSGTQRGKFVIIR